MMLYLRYAWKSVYLFRDDEDMNWCLGSDIFEGIDLFIWEIYELVLVDCFRRNAFIEYFIKNSGEIAGGSPQ